MIKTTVHSHSTVMPYPLPWSFLTLYALAYPSFNRATTWVGVFLFECVLTKCPLLFMCNFNSLKWYRSSLFSTFFTKGSCEDPSMLRLTRQVFAFGCCVTPRVYLDCPLPVRSPSDGHPDLCHHEVVMAIRVGGPVWALGHIRRGENAGS